MQHETVHENLQENMTLYATQVSIISTFWTFSMHKLMIFLQTTTLEWFADKELIFVSAWIVKWFSINALTWIAKNKTKKQIENFGFTQDVFAFPHYFFPDKLKT